MFFLIDINNFNKKEIKVKSFIRKGKLVNSYKKNINKKDNNKIKITTGILATGLGLSISSYLLLKNKYRNGIKESAKWANNNIGKVVVNKLTDAELKRPNINFVVGGLGYNPEIRHSTELASYIESRFKGHTIPVNTDSFNNLGKSVPSAGRVIYDMKTTGIRNALLKGYNPTARELASEMIAYHKAYPSHTIVSYGHSSGGTITNEAMLIVKEAGADMSKFRNITYGANNYGILESAPNSLHLVDVNDWQANPFKFPNALNIGVKKKKLSKTFWEQLIEDHGAYHYTSQKEGIEKIKQFITPEDWKPPVEKVTKSTTKKKIVNNGANNIAEEVRLLRESRGKLNNVRLSYEKALNNKNIPLEKREAVISGAKKKIDNAANEYLIRKRKFKEKIELIRSNKNAP